MKLIISLMKAKAKNPIKEYEAYLSEEDYDNGSSTCYCYDGRRWDLVGEIEIEEKELKKFEEFKGFGIRKVRISKQKSKDEVQK